MINMNSTALKEQSEFYDAHWKSFEYANPYKLRRASVILDALARTRLREPRILDLGCGAGWMTSILGQFGPTTGVDFSPATIAHATDRYDHVRFVLGDACHAPLEDCSFDVIVSQEVIEHIEDQEAGIRELHRLLAPGGYLILTTPNATTFYSMKGEQWRNYAVQPIEKWLNIASLRQLVRTHFEILSIQTVIFGVGVKNSYRISSSRRLAKVLEKLGLARYWDEVRSSLGFGLHSVVLARKMPVLTP